MDIKGRTVLILGGSGLVGMAISRRILKLEPKELIILSLTKREVEEGVKILRSENPDRIIKYDWGNIFVRSEYKDLSRSELLSNSEYRKNIIYDVINELREDILSNSYLYRIIKKYKPKIIIDSINTATGLAYQDIYLSSITTLKKAEKARNSAGSINDFADEVEKLLCTQYIPQLIRHIQILYETTKRFKTRFYFKIGTSGTGGMGLNIPYTHSEERPSRILLSKSSLAGAHSLLLFLMARTPDAPIIKEIKPTAAIAWKNIKFGKIMRMGKPVKLYDCTFDNAAELGNTLSLDSTKEWELQKGQFLEAPFIDTGENGMFSYGEFMAISSIGQMGFVTPEEIADDLIYEIQGGNTGHDIINALDNATMGPTYRAGTMRDHALQKLQLLETKHGSKIAAFEILGPPRLSKLLYEAYLLKKVGKTLKKVIRIEEEMLTSKIENLLKKDKKLRLSILSIGIPILTSDGKRLLRGKEIKIPPFIGSRDFTVTNKNINLWAHDGWIDLRKENMRLWKKRFAGILDEVAAINPSDSSSQYQWSREYWMNSEEIEIGKVVAWIFVNEDKGLRMKS